MRIVNYNEFIKQPKGTIYCEYEPCVFGKMNIFIESINDGSDFYYQEINHAIPSADSSTFTEDCKLMEEGMEITADYYCLERDGLFEYDRKFLIYSKEDIKDLINKLKTLL